MNVSLSPVRTRSVLTARRRSTCSKRGAILGRLIGTVVLFAAIGAAAYGLWTFKKAGFAASAAAAAAAPEPQELVEAALPARRTFQRTTTAIGTVLALRSVDLANETAGTVREVRLAPGAVVEEGELLVQLDVAVEEAELAAARAQLALAETLLGRIERASESQGASASDVDRARAERDVAAANVLRLQALVDKKHINAPFRARIGLSNVHEGQYLDTGTHLTTLQSVDDAVHVDFMVPQDVASALAIGSTVEVHVANGGAPLTATIVAADALIDTRTRNTTLRARLPLAPHVPSPGGSVRVNVPMGELRDVLVVPVSALRKGPMGEHVFVIVAAEPNTTRVQMRRVTSGALLGDEVVIEAGLEATERVAASGSFKLFDGMKVAVSAPAAETQQPL
jgi:membrane fusion protein (multidrug efflux system)